MVNGISDSQQKGRQASSVADLSAAAGLPRPLVDVRHEATHNELPSLQLLRLAASSALAWLQSNYWDGQASALDAAAERISQLLASLATSWRAATAAGMGGGAAACEEDDVDDDAPSHQQTQAQPAGAMLAVVAGYSGSEGQRLRREAMSELRALVPPAFTRTLVQPLLACEALQPQAAAAGAGGPAGCAGGGAGALPSSSGRPAVQQQGLVEERAWQSVMRHLRKFYPRLRALVLEAAVHALCSAATGGDDTSAEAAASYSRWVLRLLPAAPAVVVAQAAAPESSRSGSGKTPRKASQQASTQKGVAVDGASSNGPQGAAPEPDPSTAVSPQQLQQLMAAILPATAIVSSLLSQRLGMNSSSAVQAGSQIAALSAPLDALTTALSALCQAHRAAPGAPTLPAVLARLIELTQRAAAAFAAKPDPAVTGVQAAAVTDGSVEEAEQRQAQLLMAASAPCAELPPDGGVATTVAKREQPDGDVVGCGRARKWRRCETWSACAIGCLPSASDLNGRVPTLYVRPEVALSSADEQELEVAALGSYSVNELALGLGEEGLGLEDWQAEGVGLMQGDLEEEEPAGAGEGACTQQSGGVLLRLLMEGDGHGASRIVFLA